MTSTEARPVDPAVREVAVEVELESPVTVPVDWADVTVPREDAEALGIWGPHPRAVRFQDQRGQSFPVLVRDRVGYQGVRVFVAAPFDDLFVQGTLVPAAGHSEAKFTAHRSLLTAAEPRVNDKMADSRAIVRANRGEIVERFVWHVAQGVVAVIFRQRVALHPVENFWLGTVVTGVQTVDELQGRTVAVRVTVPGAQVALSGLSNFIEVEQDRENSLHMIVRQDWGARVPVMFRAHHPDDSDAEEDPITSALRATVTETRPRGWCRYRMRGGEGGRWLALGVSPEADGDGNDQLWAGIREFYNGDHSVYDARASDQAMSTNVSGTQRFGASFSGQLFLQDGPAHAYGWLRHSVESELLRPVNWLVGSHALPMRARDYPGLRTNNRRIHWRVTSETLGLPAEPPRVAPNSRRTADDEQHMDDLGISAFIAMFDDPDIEELREGLVQIDLCETGLHIASPNTASRGIGRPMLSNANAAWLLHLERGGREAEALAEMQFLNLRENWSGKRALELGQIEVLVGRIHKPDVRMPLVDPRTGEPAWYAIPYEEAALVTGLMAAAQVMRAELANEALMMALRISETVIRWAFRDENGQLEFPYAIMVGHGDEEGVNVADEWPSVDQPEFRMTRMRGRDWTRWTVPVAFALPYLIDAVGTVPDDVEDAAAELRSQSMRQDDLFYRYTALPQSIAEATPLSRR